MTTARELGPAGWKTYFGPASTAPSGEIVAPEERERLLERVREAVHLLKQRLGARRVVLFGSLAHGGWFFTTSDVDLGVLGLEGEAFWQGWRLVEDIVGERRVDLVALELASEPLQRAIERDGVEL
ncbi:MAG: nucleotidyltransferase domain-containing protein [Chloroflexi bacterium]|nr:nucleotidyltransferase domain-containing protein [Chloroflexota bacterium]